MKSISFAVAVFVGRCGRFIPPKWHGWCSIDGLISWRGVFQINLLILRCNSFNDVLLMLLWRVLCKSLGTMKLWIQCALALKVLHKLRDVRCLLMWFSVREVKCGISLLLLTSHFIPSIIVDVEQLYPLRRLGQRIVDFC